MPSPADLFLRLPLCEACEQLLTAPQGTFDKRSIQDQMFLTSDGYQYTRSRKELETSFMLGCELCKAIVANDSSYGFGKGTPRGVGDLTFDGQRPPWYPSISQRLVLKFRRSSHNNLRISCMSLRDGTWRAHPLGSSSIEWGVYTAEDDPCRHYIKTSAPMKGLVHQRDFKIAKHWLRECGASHEDCPNQTRAALPTRLIELSPLGAPKTTRLRSTAGRNGIYTALSYCWGGTQPFKTTLSNVSAYEESLPYSNLPKTISDTSEVARNLDFHLI